MTENPSADERAWQRMVALPGNEFEFQIGRGDEVINRDGTEHGLSEAALDALHRHLMVYIGTRLFRHYEQTRKSAQSVRVVIAVHVDDLAPSTFNDDNSHLRVDDDHQP